jgi:hypothetical protein
MSPALDHMSMLPGSHSRSKKGALAEGLWSRGNDNALTNVLSSLHTDAIFMEF